MSSAEDFSDLKPILLNVGYDILKKDSVIKILSPFSRVLYIVSGQGRIIHDGKTTYLKEKYLYGIQPYFEVEFIVDEVLELYYYHVYNDTISYHDLFDSYQLKLEVQSIDLDLMILKRLVEINPGKELKETNYSLNQKHTVSKRIKSHKRDPFSTSIETEGILKQLFTRFIDSSAKPTNHIDSRIRKVLRYIRDNIQQEISEEKLAEIAVMSKDYFIRLFKKELNNTPCKYINEKKIEWAQLQLLTTNISVGELATMLSYNDPSYFIRMFTKIAGKTPYKYRSNDL